MLLYFGGLVPGFMLLTEYTADIWSSNLKNCKIEIDNGHSGNIILAITMHASDIQGCLPLHSSLQT